MIYITGATTTTLPRVNAMLIQVNTALTGTITISDGDGVKAIVTNPGITPLRYSGFNGAVSIVTSATCNITVSLLNQVY